jgi:hypothetical protein
MVIEEPDIEIGAGVSSKGKQFSLIRLSLLTFEQPLVDALLLTLPVEVEAALTVAVEVILTIIMARTSSVNKTTVRPMILATSRHVLSQWLLFPLLFPASASNFPALDDWLKGSEVCVSCDQLSKRTFYTFEWVGIVSIFRFGIHVRTLLALHGVVGESVLPRSRFMRIVQSWLVFSIEIVVHMITTDPWF